MATAEGLAQANTRDEIFASLSLLIQAEFGFAPDDIRLETDLIDDLDFDSIDAIDMAVRVEEITGTGIPEDDLKEIRTVNDVVDFLLARSQAGAN